MKNIYLGIIILLATSTQSVFAQESEFKAKLDEDIATYVPKVEAACGKGIKIAWTGGKLGVSPRDSGISTLVTSALDGIESLCLNKPVMKAHFSKTKSIEFKKGTGTMKGKVSGSKLEVSIDEKFTANNAAGQEDDFNNDLVKQVDK